jgi:antitoxin ParD1/3/4
MAGPAAGAMVGLMAISVNSPEQRHWLLTLHHRRLGRRGRRQLRVGHVLSLSRSRRRTADIPDGALELVRRPIDNHCQRPDDPCMSTTSTMNIALPEPMRAYVAKRVESGQFGNTSEYVRELIRRDQREQDIARLRAMVEVGLASGPARPDTAEDWAELEAIARGSKA